MIPIGTLHVVHMICAGVSIAGYILRAILMLIDSPLLDTHASRTAPHVVDSLLLLSGLGLAWETQQYPFVQSWLTAKIVALLLYILLGAVGLHYGRTKGVRATAALGAILVFGYIVGVATTRSASVGLW